MSIKLKITVTADIIRRSVPGSANYCALATAVKDIFPRAAVLSEYIVPFRCDAIACYGVSSGITLTGREQAFPTTKSIQQFVRAFDLRKFDEVSDDFRQEFELEVPDWAIEKVDISEVQKLLIDHPTLQIIE